MLISGNSILIKMKFNNFNVTDNKKIAIGHQSMWMELIFKFKVKKKNPPKEILEILHNTLVLKKIQQYVQNLMICQELRIIKSII